MVIKYENLTIRSAEAADAEQLCAWWNDGRIMAQFCMPNGANCTPEQVRKRIVDNQDEARGLYIIELDGKPIGEMSYRNFCYPEGIIVHDGKPISEADYRNMDGAVEPGIKICDFSARDKGYGAKLLTVFIDALFRYYGYESVILDTDLKNERAQHVYENKLGFRRLGIHKDSSHNESESEYYESVVYFGMSRADWFALQKEAPEYSFSRTE